MEEKDTTQRYVDRNTVKRLIQEETDDRVETSSESEESKTTIKRYRKLKKKSIIRQQ